MKVTVLSSGSKGNSTLIETKTDSLLIDAGLSCKRLLQRIEDAGRDYTSIRGIVITHDHSDHIKGAGITARKLNIPVYIHQQNYNNKIDLFNKCDIRIIKNKFSIGSMKIEPFRISHDGTENYAYNIYSGNKKISHLTDTGTATTLIRQKVKGCNLFVVESNHDPEMLKNGPYPWYLKQRVSGKKGHLSNADACNLVKDTFHDDLKHVILAHLSQENNDPLLAREEMEKIMAEENMNFMLHVGSQDKIVKTIEI